MPVHNEAPSVPDTMEALVLAVAESGFDAEVVLVDDGSTDGTADIAERALTGRLPMRIVRQPNRGRFEARRAGVSEASAETVLLLDGRVRMQPGALAFVRPRLAAGERVWTSHVHVEDGGRALGAFWRLLAELAWPDYFDVPRTTSFGVEDFDRFPKGTTCLLAPRSLLLDAFDAFRSGYTDLRHANDDTPVLRWIAEREPIHVSPSYSSSYTPRSDVGPFLGHAYHRGLVFLDGHGRPASRFFPVAVGFFPLSAAWVIGVARRPLLAPATAACVAATAAVYAVRRGKSARDAASLALATPLYAAGHAAGMWAGLVLRLRALTDPGCERPPL
jgi:glycosyltransferase involved in cell wall biosynthesis